MGLFADYDMDCGLYFLEYIGERIDNADFMRLDALYASYGWDNQHIQKPSHHCHLHATMVGNHARFSNQSSLPNSKVERIELIDSGFDVVWMKALEHIRRGDQIVREYAYYLFNPDNIVICECSNNYVRPYI